MDKKETKDLLLAILLIIVVIGIGWYYRGGHSTSKQASENTKVAMPDTILKHPEEGFIIGDENAPVTIVEYTNFLCSHCADFVRETMPKIEERYVKVGLVKFNIIIVPPVELGEAAFCALEQSKFVEYHDYLFEHQGDLNSKDDLIAFAEKVNMNKDLFGTCLEPNRYGEIIDNWITRAGEKEVTGTPTFFIGATDKPDDYEKIVGAESLDVFEKAIQKYFSHL